MSWNKSTRREDGFDNIIEILNNLNVDYTVDTLCTVSDRSLSSQHTGDDNIEIKYLTTPVTKGGYHHKVIRSPGPDADDIVKLVEVEHDNKGRFVVLERRFPSRFDQKDEKYELKEVQSNKHKKKV